MQSIANADFTVAAKFDSSPNAQYQGEGILVQQDESTYLRIEFSSDGNLTDISALLVSSGSQQGFLQSQLSNGGSPLWLQVQRRGDNWTISYSNDGTSYASAGTFTEPLTVTAIGPYAWNYNNDPTQAPAFNSAVDYFYNLNSGGGGSNPPEISNVNAAPSSASSVITWSTDEPSTSTINYGTATSYGSNVSDAALVTVHKHVSSSPHLRNHV